MSLRLMYSLILLRSIAQVLLLNHLPSQDLESRDTTKKVEDLFRAGGARITKQFTNWKKPTQKLKIILKK